MIQLSMQNWPRMFIMCHSINYSQLEIALGRYGLNARSVGSVINSVVGDVVLLCYTEDTSEERGTPPVPVCEQSPRISPIKKG